MSRVGKKPIIIPGGVEVKIEDNIVIVKGPKGELSYETRPEIEAVIKEGKIFVLPQIDTKLRTKTPKENKFPTGQASSVRGKKAKVLWGLTRTLISNLIKGVTEGYQKKLEIEGLGYRAALEGEDLILQVGFTHPVKIKCPAGIKFSVEKNVITVSGIDKELVGQVAAKIRRVRPPEPYKGKGIRYFGEVIRRKAGKRAATTG